ncbi:MAG TPA: hypothetical protein VLD36_20365 [Burkholderiales bacterium]|jgi:hypothetical protein|nr:hypothetical protein [Burkholderiales bacterium]
MFRRGLPTLPRRQEGVVLFVALAMLVAFTLFALAMIRMSGSEFMAIHNQQIRGEMERAGIEAIEVVVNSQDFFNQAAEKTAVKKTVNINGYSVELAPPVCYGTHSLKYSVMSPVASNEVLWEITATVTDPQTQSKVRVVEGIRLRMAAGSCVT